MNIYEIESIMNNIDDKYIYESNEYIESKNNLSHRNVRKISNIAACFIAFILLFMSTLTIAAAAGNIPAYDILYSLYPEAARKFTPVNVSCEDNGIKMEVEAVYIHDEAAEIYISMKDLEGNRIDETIDLFDSYAIHSSSDSIGTCSFIEYDPESKEAVFLIYLQQMNNKKITGRKLTFSVSEFLSGKKEIEEEIPEILLENIDTVSNVQNDIKRRGWGGVGANKNSIEQISGFLMKNEQQSFSPVKGVTVSAYGLIDDQLHIQVHYEDILNTDNHGYVYLKDKLGNIINCNMNVSFWDEEHTGSYEEYIFDIDSEEELKDYSVWGYFNTCQNLTTGDWEVTFPIEERE